jgi:phage-related protein
MAVEKGYITSSDLDAAVRIQQERLPLGRILVDMGKITDDELSDLLFEQKVRRGEIRDVEVITQHERLKMHRKIREVRSGLKEIKEDAKRAAATFFTATTVGRAK